MEKGLKQTDLAKRLRVDEMTIVNWERGRTVPRKAYNYRLRQYLDIKV